LADPGPPTWPALDVEHVSGAGAPADFDDRLALVFDDLDIVAVESGRAGHWRAYFTLASARDIASAVLRDTLGDQVALRAIDVPDEGWALKVQSSLGAIRVDGLVVAPPWDVVAGEQGHRDEGARVIVIEPSMGFGTGHHQSTRLCLRVLQRLPIAGRTVLDVGTGSGVLAIAAACLGAARVTAFDNDPDAVAAARDNAVRNAVTHLVDVRLDDLGRMEGPAAPTADVVVANLTANVIRRLREPLVRLVGARGHLVTSGFTHDQVDLVRESLEPLTLVSRQDEDDWVALVFAA
jgi:ribosomal protein L11 methyltransferase